MIDVDETKVAVLSVPTKYGVKVVPIKTDWEKLTPKNYELYLRDMKRSMMDEIERLFKENKKESGSGTNRFRLTCFRKNS